MIARRFPANWSQLLQPPPSPFPKTFFPHVTSGTKFNFIIITLQVATAAGAVDASISPLK
jgi:hypothetical protein